MTQTRIPISTVSSSSSPLLSATQVTQNRNVDLPNQQHDATRQVILHVLPAEAQNLRQRVRQAGGQIIREIPALNRIVVRLPENLDVGVQALSSQGILAQEEDAFIQALSVPNDPYYPQQWALSSTGISQAWPISLRLPSVSVAIIDSGICSHSDIPLSQLDMQAAWDFIDGDALPEDTFGHGCQLAGILIAEMHNNIGIAGAAPHSHIMPLRVLDDTGLGRYSDVAAAIVHAVDNGARIINLSIGGTTPSTLLEDAIAYSTTRNVRIVAAAGNNNSDVVLYPARYANVLAVGAIDSVGQVAPFSSIGLEIDVWAPGVEIVTTDLNDAYTSVNGTSFATAYVVSVIANEMAWELVYEPDENLLAIDASLLATLQTGACLADLDLSRSVDILDVQQLAGAYSYNPAYDLNWNGVLDILDIQRTASYFNQSCKL